MTPKSNDTELKKIDFSQKPMGVPPIPFLGLEMVKKGASIAFLLLTGTKAKMTKYDILNPNLFVPDDYH